MYNLTHVFYATEEDHVNIATIQEVSACVPSTPLYEGTRCNASQCEDKFASSSMRLGSSEVHIIAQLPYRVRRRRGASSGSTCRCTRAFCSDESTQNAAPFTDGSTGAFAWRCCAASPTYVPRLTEELQDVKLRFLKRFESKGIVVATAMRKDHCNIGRYPCVHVRVRILHLPYALAPFRLPFLPFPLRPPLYICVPMVHVWCPTSRIGAQTWRPRCTIAW